MITTQVVQQTDDLNGLVTQINEADWDEGNEICLYDVESLQGYLSRQDTFFIIASSNDRQILMGMASGRVEVKPYKNEQWLYVDEVDVCVDHRKKGVGKALMRQCFELARQANCEEVWLGTEVDNLEANALYRALEPDDIGQVVGYTYELD